MATEGRVGDGGEGWFQEKCLGQCKGEFKVELCLDRHDIEYVHVRTCTCYVVAIGWTFFHPPRADCITAAEEKAVVNSVLV